MCVRLPSFFEQTIGGAYHAVPYTNGTKSLYRAMFARACETWVPLSSVAPYHRRRRHELERPKPAGRVPIASCVQHSPRSALRRATGRTSYTPPRCSASPCRRQHQPSTRSSKTERTFPSLRPPPPRFSDPHSPENSTGTRLDPHLRHQHPLQVQTVHHAEPECGLRDLHWRIGDAL